MGNREKFSRVKARHKFLQGTEEANIIMIKKATKHKISISNNEGQEEENMMDGGLSSHGEEISCSC